MEILQAAFQYFLKNQSAFWHATRQHLVLSSAAMSISLLIGLPVGVWVAHREKIAQTTINIFNVFRVIPSLAVLFLALPYLGLGFTPSLVALSFLAVAPILINTYAGLRGVDRAIIEAASGMGMSASQVLFQIEIPLAAPAIVTGIRIAAVEVISSATLASFIGGGGLGDFITRGFALYDVPIMLVGALPVALLALLSEAFWTLFLRLYRKPGH
ncbi:MAG: ABC transporter permease [Anaerolineaceae bacterium]|nr:ABC transporter permease [Anaerolineaceae bacterium]